MLNNIFTSIAQSEITPSVFLICSAVSLLLGFLLSLNHLYRSRSSKGFAITVALLPLTVQVVIMLVNGNLGTGLAVAGAFSLVRFRSVAGSAKEILSIFTAMAAGLATGVGNIGVAAVFVLLAVSANLVYTKLNLGKALENARELKITVPEGLNFTDAFEDIFKKYTYEHTLKSVKTSNMGSLYRLRYSVRLKNAECERELIDSLRCRNGNLEISSCNSPTVCEEL